MFSFCLRWFLQEITSLSPNGNTINKSTRRAQTSAMGAQFLDFQNLPLALILLFSPLYFIFLPTVIRITPNFFFMDPDSDPDHSQNLLTCSLSHLGHILKITSKSVHNFFELSVFKNYISWIQKIQITPKIESFFSF